MSGDGQNSDTGRSGLYVDLENLHADGQPMIENLIENWPDKVPSPARLRLYVRADQVELWRLWADSRFPNLEVVVHGTQHFSLSPTKNSADIAIATNSMADLVLGRVTHVVVFSDDSDFISLYAAIRDEPAIPLLEEQVPFFWVVTDREGSLSATVKQFFPPRQLHVVENNARKQGRQKPVSGSTESNGAAMGTETAEDVYTHMARAVAREVDEGQFRSTDCQGIIRKHWPDHPLASAGRVALWRRIQELHLASAGRLGSQDLQPWKEPGPLRDDREGEEISELNGSQPAFRLRVRIRGCRVTDNPS